MLVLPVGDGHVESSRSKQNQNQTKAHESFTIKSYVKPFIYGLKLTLTVHWLTVLSVCGETSDAATCICVIVTFAVRDTLVTWPYVASLTLALEAASSWSANLKTIIFNEKKPQGHN